MKIRKVEIITDNKVDRAIREYGVTKLAKEVKVEAPYISMCLNKNFTMSWKVYSKILEVLE